MKAFLKDIVREITHSLGRFLSIMLIVAIGTAFFAGVKASVPDMKNSADNYFDKQNLVDIRMMSTMGFSKEDVNAIKKIKNIEGIDATYSMNFLADKGTSQLVVKTIAWQPLKEDDPNYINQPRLIEGRLPNKANECLIEANQIKQSHYQIGDTITLKSGTSDTIDHYLSRTKYTIVGTCFTPDYLSYEKGSSTIGSGKVDTFIMIDKSNYIMDYYTEVLLRVNDAKVENCYHEDYFKVIDPVVNALESVGIERSDIRYEEIKKIANDKWNENNQIYLNNKQQFEEGIKAGEQKLEDAKTKLVLGQANLTSAKANFETLQISMNAQITQAQSTLSMYESQLNEIIVMRDNAQAKYDSMIPQYNESIQLAKEHIADLEEDLQKVETEAEKQVIQVQIDSWKNSLANAETAKQALEATLSSMNDKINAYEQLITNAKQEIATQKAALSQAKVEADAKFAQAETELTNGQKQYSEGVVALEKQKTITEEELAIAKEKLDAAKVQLDNIDPPSWYVLDRHSHYSYRDYESVADRMDGIAKVFPVFFLIVAALVCLTTMTRMVDEQRNIIGTYKALGYSKIAIAFKYLSYALIAGIIGSIVGCLIGMHLFPSVIFNAWNLMYNLPTLVFTPQLPLALISSVCVVGVTLMAAGFACYKELVEVPASLMRPKAPKQGKKILLEKIPILWSRFSFTMKVTARNIFRYKKRFFMTVIGISGCTALLLAGFGIKDSIAQIVDIQYGEIIQYDALIKLDNQDALINRRKAIEKLNDYSLTKDSLALTTLNASVDIDNATQSISLLIPDDSEKLKDYINLRTRNKKEQIELSSDGAVVSEKLAKNLKASVGDMISITFDDGIKHDIKISSICENYVGHNIYITPSYYKTLTSQRVSENTVLLKMKKANEQNERKLGNYFVKEESVSSISFNSGVADTFADTISSISFVTYVLIAAAGLLAFVVLYNLTNVNISERLREIATIKVLGFYDLEVASYVYRENIFLTLIGSLAGLGLGVILHRLIMNLAEMPEIMFGRNINLLSYCLAVMITALFAMIVNLVMYNKLKKIPMVESLKSVE